MTHMFNDTPPLHHRGPGPVSAALAAAGRGEVALEVMDDGVHLAPATVAMLFDLVGDQSIALVTHARSASGMPEGTYLGGRDVVVSGRTARFVEGGAIAGWVATLLDVVLWFVESGASRCWTPLPLPRPPPARPSRFAAVVRPWLATLPTSWSSTRICRFKPTKVTQTDTEHLPGSGLDLRTGDPVFELLNESIMCSLIVWTTR